MGSLVVFCWFTPYSVISWLTVIENEGLSLTTFYKSF